MIITMTAARRRRRPRWWTRSPASRSWRAPWTGPRRSAAGSGARARPALLDDDDNDDEYSNDMINNNYY